MIHSYAHSILGGRGGGLPSGRGEWCISESVDREESFKIDAMTTKGLRTSSFRSHIQCSGKSRFNCISIFPANITFSIPTWCILRTLFPTMVLMLLSHIVLLNLIES